MNTYHCLCSTVLLATPYTLSSLPRRAAPSLDHAYILPLPALSTSSLAGRHNHHDSAEHARNPSQQLDDYSVETEEAAAQEKEESTVPPSLLAPALRPARKLVVVRREDGFERRRMYRCGRCGIGVGYEIEGQRATGARLGGPEKEVRVIYLLEGGLVGTEEMGKEGG